LIWGIRNPPSFKPTKPFSNLYLQTNDYFNITQASEQQAASLYIQTKNVAIIQSYTVTQQTEEVGGIGPLEIVFTPVNPLTKDGAMTLRWSDQIQIFNDTTCKVQTYKDFGNEQCLFDINQKTLTVSGIFQNGFKGAIKLTLSKVRNPLSNRKLSLLEIRTFADAKLLYPMDLLNVLPKLRCNYPCLDCGATPD